MKTPNLWQKLVSTFKRPMRKPPSVSKRDVYGEAMDPRWKDEDTSVYHKKKGSGKLRKRRKCMENKSRAINYRKAKNG